MNTSVYSPPLQPAFEFEEGIISMKKSVNMRIKWSKRRETGSVLLESKNHL